MSNTATESNEVTLVTLESEARRYAEAHEELALGVMELQALIEHTKHSHLRALVRKAERTSNAKDRLNALIDGNRHLFAKRKTLTLAGVKVGLAKGKGKVTFKDPEKVLTLIKRHFPEQADALINKTEKPDKDALGKLAADDLKRLGVEITGTGEAVVIKPEKGDVSKLLAALMGEAEVEE